MPTDRPTPGSPRSRGNRGSSPVGGAAAPARSRGKLIALVLGAIVVLVLLALLLSRCGSSSDNDTGSSAGSSTASGSSSSGSATSSAASSSPASTDATATTPAGPTAGAGTAGTLTAGTQSLTDAAASTDPATALAALTGQPVSATAVQVLSVPADEGFWVGTSDTDRIWVQLTGSGESGYQVVQGDTVDFTGVLVAHDPTFAGTVGVDDAEGAAQLTTQAQHVEVAKGAVTLTP